MQETSKAFVATPSVVEFLDFDVGERYELKLTLTNVSYGFNSIHVSYNISRGAIPRLGPKDVPYSHWRLPWRVSSTNLRLPGALVPV